MGKYFRCVKRFYDFSTFCIFGKCSMNPKQRNPVIKILLRQFSPDSNVKHKWDTCLGQFSVRSENTFIASLCICFQEKNKISDFSFDMTIDVFPFVQRRGSSISDLAMYYKDELIDMSVRM